MTGLSRTKKGYDRIARLTGSFWQGFQCYSPPKTQKSKPDLQIWICLRSIWQGFQSVNGTFDPSDIECDVQEIRELLKAESNSDLDVPLPP